MPKRARFDGPSDDIQIYDSEEGPYAAPIATVKRGGYLPEDVPARIRDELLARDNWTEVDYTPPGKKKDGDS